MRGQINNRERAKQLVDFSGLRWGSITPTDIDGLIEYKDKGFIFLEFKVEGVELKRGQELAFERMVDNLEKPSILFVANHNYPPENDIDAANCFMVRYYFEKVWRPPSCPIRLKDAIDFFVKWKLG